MNFFYQRLVLTQSRGDFIYGDDLDWPSLSFRCHSRPARSFQHKIDCIACGKRNGQSYYRILIGSRTCSVQWRRPLRSWSTFQGQTVKNYPPSEINVCGSGRQQRCPICFVAVKSYPEHSRVILVLAEVSALWVLSSFSIVKHNRNTVTRI